MSDEPLRLSLILEAGSPIILLPVSCKSSDLLVVDLGQLSVSNVFKFSGDEGTISMLSELPQSKCLLEVMIIQLQNMDLYSGEMISELSSPRRTPSNLGSFSFGSNLITKKGPSLLTKKFHLRLQVEQNLHKKMSHLVPDMSIYGQLSTLDGTLDLKQYKLIRGLLAFNLGEDTEKINPSVPKRLISTEVSILREGAVLTRPNGRFVFSHNSFSINTGIDHCVRWNIGLDCYWTYLCCRTAKEVQVVSVGR